MLLRYLGYINYKTVSPDGKTRINQIRKVTEEEGKRLLTSNRDRNAWEVVSDEQVKVEAKVIVPDENKADKAKSAIELDDKVEVEVKEVKKAGRPKKSSRLGF